MKTTQSMTMSSLVQAFGHVKTRLQHVAQMMQQKDITLYPIFVMCQKALSLPSLVAEQHTTHGTWFIYAVYLEFLEHQQWLTQTGIETLKKNYKPPATFCCILVLDKNLQKLIYIPYHTLEHTTTE